MSYLGTSQLQQLLPSCIDKFNPARIQNVAYELSLGDEAYLTDSSSGKKDKLDDKNTQVVIKPGQFALLLTEETVTIPSNILAFISVKFSQKIKGLINVSGFHVDPGFSGKIIFSVYNAGPTVIVLDKGSPYFMIWFSELTSPSNIYNGKHNGQKSISAENISQLQGELASPNILMERIRGNESKLTNFFWAATVAVALGVTLTARSCYESSKFNEGYHIGVKEQQAKQYIDSAWRRQNGDSLFCVKLDSLIRINLSDTTKKGK